MSAVFNLIGNKYHSISLALSSCLESVSLLLLRLVVARVFLMSGLTKWDGLFQFNTEKYDLFLYEYFCPDPVRPGALQLCSPDTQDYVEGSMTVSVRKAFCDNCRSAGSNTANITDYRTVFTICRPGSSGNDTVYSAGCISGLGSLVGIRLPGGRYHCWLFLLSGQAAGLLTDCSGLMD